MLEVTSLSCGYEKEILQDISLCLENGKVTGILGYNGCGKTTLIRAICGFIPYKGMVLWDKKDISKLSVRNRAKIVTCMPQVPPSTKGITVRDYAMMGLYPQNFFSLGEKKNKNMLMEHARQLGIEKLLHQDLSLVSAGERQMASLLRICMQEAPCILLDEPTAALDAHNAYKLLNCIEDLRQSNRAIFCVFHDPALALNYCDVLYLLKDGKIFGKLECKTCTLEDASILLKNIYSNLYIGLDKKINKYYCCWL